MKLKKRKYIDHGHVICDQCGYRIKDPDFSGRSPTRRQLRCTVKNGRPGQRKIASYSECQASFHHKRLRNKTMTIKTPKAEVKCRACGKEIKRARYNQKACAYPPERTRSVRAGRNGKRPAKRKMTPCQLEYHLQQKSDFRHRRRQEKKKVNSKKPCLKCDKGFKATGKHNRLCEDCERANSHVKYRVYRVNR